MSHFAKRVWAKAARSLLQGALVLIVASCSNPGEQFSPLPDAPPASTYRLGSGDQLRVTTFGEAQLTGEFRVSATGDIAMPLIGRVHAANLTVPELERAIEDQMRTANSFRDPNVVVEVIGYRPIFVLGEVSRPGEYPFQPGMTVVTAAAVAGGFTYRAAKDEFSIVRNQGTAAVEGRAVRQTALQPGDIITVYERHF